MFSINANGPAEMEKELLRLANEVWDHKDTILRLNRLVASQKSEIEKLSQYIKDLKKAGSYDDSDNGKMLLEVMEKRIPYERVTRQRKEIATLHRIIKELKEERDA